MEYKLEEFITYEQPAKYIVESDQYNDSYDIPVLTAGQTFILGYTNEQDNIFDNLPVIIFDDFTTSVQYVDFPFKVKSSAMKLLKNTSKSNLKYCYYMLKYFQKQPENHKRQWISSTSQIKIDLPNIDNQSKIVEKLDFVQEIIAKYKRQLNMLDELVKARFVEMFGDPLINEKGWKIRKLKNISNKIGSGATPKGGQEVYIHNGISLIRSMNVYNNRFEYKELAHITDEQAKKLSNVKVEKNDILLNITGASVARCYIVPIDILPARVNQHVCIIRCKEIIHPIFLHGVITNKEYQNHLLKLAGTGATREAINKQQIESLDVIFPPIELQNQFADFVKEVDKSRFIIKSMIKEGLL